METVLLVLLDTPVTVGMAAIAGGGLALALLAWLLMAVLSLGREREREAVAQLARQAQTEERVAELVRAQSEAAGRLQALGEVLGTGQSDLARAVAERLDGVSQRVGDGLSTGARATAEQLQKLESRLAVIDAAQKNIGSLAEQVTGLKAILANKPARGAFGQGRMEAIVRDALPQSAYTFQIQLSTGVRPDCGIHLPGDPRVLALDAKFPLEAFEELRRATSAEAEERAATRFRQDVSKHVRDIAGKYLVPGETQDVALLFVPSEALYGELHERFDDVVQRAHRARVLVVSPSLLMLAIQLVQGLVRDAAMREQAHVIQAEVGHLLDDLRRLGERIGKLKAHIGQTATDLDQIELSAAKIAKRGLRIEQMEFDSPGEPAERLPNPVAPRMRAAE